MPRKLFVGGLPWATTDEELQAAFAPHGSVVSAHIVRDRDSGRSRGFGFVEYDDEESGQRAIEALHESDLGGRKIHVAPAQGPKK